MKEIIFAECGKGDYLSCCVFALDDNNKPFVQFADTDRGWEPLSVTVGARSLHALVTVHYDWRTSTKCRYNKLAIKLGKKRFTP